MSAPANLRLPVPGGDLTVHLWRDLTPEPILAIHGITASSMAWTALAERTSQTLIAPDLRGRGGSQLPGPYGLQTHADDCRSVLDELNVDRARVVGHSMGGFVAAVFAHRYPERVAKLVLVDGGAKLPAQNGDPDDLLGPAAARLRMTFDSPQAYRDFWRQHPAFKDQDWSDAITAYVDYDLAPNGRSRVVEEAMRADFRELHGDTVPPPPNTPFIRAERGLLDEPTPLYPDEPADLDVRTVPGTNHYSILFGRDGTTAIEQALEETDA